jgi:hypothetical protein
MAKMAAQVFGIAMVESQENTCSTLLTSVSYSNLPTTFVGGVSSGISRSSASRQNSGLNHSIWASWSRHLFPTANISFSRGADGMSPFAGSRKERSSNAMFKEKQRR